MLNPREILVFVPWRDVRFGSVADMRTATSDVRYTPNSNCKNGLPQKVMSALPPIVLQNYFDDQIEQH